MSISRSSKSSAALKDKLPTMSVEPHPTKRRTVGDEEETVRPRGTHSRLRSIKAWFAKQHRQTRRRNVISHGRSVTFQMAEVAVPRLMLVEILS
jgi:hypothetical protein